MNNNWFKDIRELRPTSIAPVPQDKPPLAFIVIVFGICVSPLAGLVFWGWM